MKITSIKENRNIETNELKGYILNNSIYILSFECRYKKDIENYLKSNKIEVAFTSIERTEYLKNKLKLQIKNEFNKKYQKSIIHSDQIDEDIDAGIDALRDVSGLIDILADDDSVEFRLANNSFKTISKNDLIEIKKEINRAAQTLFKTKWDLEKQVDELSSENVEFITVDFEKQLLILNDKKV